jgi:predicted negative regulator of RcsB-dependent stress response
MLAAVVVDTKPWDDALKTWAAKQKSFVNRICYGNVLLAADKGADAEKVFREQYQLAANQADLTTAIEGIAKSLRAEDGNVGRANAWLMSLQKASTPKP